MDNKSLVKITNSRSLAANKGFRESWNFVVEFFRLLSEGVGIKFHWRGARLVIDANNNQPFQSSAGGGQEYKLAFDTTLPFHLTRNSDGTLTMSDLVFWHNGMRFVGGSSNCFSISFADGYKTLSLKIRYGNDSGPLYSDMVESELCWEPGTDRIYQQKADQVLEMCFPLYEFYKESDGTISVVADYVHGMPSPFSLGLSYQLREGDKYYLDDCVYSDSDGKFQKIRKHDVAPHAGA